MKILALEFSSPVRSVAVAVDGAVRGHAHESGGRDTHAFAMISNALQQAEVTREQIECVAVGTGPGSYAGIRIAIAIAQGWQLARGVKLLGISSADCVAAQIHARGWRGKLNVAIDAQRGELFAAQYEISDAGSHIIEPFRLMTDANTGAPGVLFVRPDVIESSPDYEAIVPDARMLATLAESRVDFVRGPDLDAVYLRKAEFVKAPPAREMH